MCKPILIENFQETLIRTKTVGPAALGQKRKKEK